MAKNSIELQEQKILDHINEGFMTRAMKNLLKVLSGTTVKRTMRRLDKEIKNDPEVQAALNDFFAHRERVQDKIKGFCDRHPDSYLCLKKKRR